VNALGQRVKKVASGVTTIFVYDEQGRLLGEYNGAGALIQETVWLEDLPIATLRPTGSGNPTPIAIYYVHADHLGSPRAVTRASDNASMWRWDNVDAFGANTPNQNPAGQGTFKYNLRFPGQYYDAETGTHYNYFRDYDPTIGRYVESDPMGLKAGLNSYAYVDSDPLRFIDSLGLAKWIECGPCKIRFDSDPHKGRHAHWYCPGEAEGCIKPDGTLCEGSKPPRNRVRRCLEDAGFLAPQEKAPAFSCNQDCQKTWKLVRDLATGMLVLMLVCATFAF
jgi:RHS repeat-associated protein